MSEARLASLTTAVLGGSFFVALLGLLVIFGAASTGTGDQSLALSPFFWKGAALFVGYFISVVAVSTLRDKGRARRILSWSYTTAFHTFVVLYVAFTMELHGAVFVLLSPEIVVIALSATGTTLALGSTDHVHARV